MNQLNCQFLFSLGRRLTFYFSAIVGFIGSVLIMTTSHNYIIFCISAVMSALTLMSLFQAPLIISMETSDPWVLPFSLISSRLTSSLPFSASRGKIAMWQCIGWTFGLCALPMILWLVGNWVWFMAVTSVPTLIFLFFPYYMIESPRWLANRKQYAKCAQMLNRIATINKRDVRFSEGSLREAFGRMKEEKTYGMMSLFSHWRLFRNTVLLIMGRTITNIAYLTIMLNCSKMAGNPFMNFFYQSLIELPAFILGQHFADRIGRRYTNTLSFIGAAVLCVPVIMMVKGKCKDILRFEHILTFVYFLRSWIGILCDLGCHNHQVLCQHQLFHLQLASDGNIPDVPASDRSLGGIYLSEYDWNGWTVHCSIGEFEY